MKAVLLVGGMGTRLRPLTYRIPKPLIPVMGKPLIMHVIDSLPREVDEVIIPIGYKKRAMEEHLLKDRPRRRITIVDEAEPMGTGGAVKNVEDRIDGSFLVINGDIISSLDISRFIEFHRGKEAFATISLWPVEDPTPYGVVDLGSDKRIRRFQEKPSRDEAFSNLINAGAYALEHEILDHIGQGFVSMERDVFPKILDRGMYGMEFEGHWIDCGRREDLLRAFWTLMGDDELSVARECVQEGVVAKPPVVVRDGAVVAGATVGPRAYISERAVVGLRAVVEGSVVLEGAQVGANCRIVDSIIDSSVSVPEGSQIISTIVSNATEE